MVGKLQVFVAVKGHAFERDAFEAMFRAIDVEPTMVDQPAAAMLLNPEAMARFDALCFYDMPGMDFRAPIAERPDFVPPEPAFQAGFQALLAQGKGIVALHHAIAGWPAWDAYREALGGCFLYKPATAHGAARGDSGYIGGLTYTARIAPGGHPVSAGLPPTFALTDELYRMEVFDDLGLEPLLTLDETIDPDRFHSAVRSIRRIPDGEGERRPGPAPSPLLSWAKAAGNSPLVYIQPGDSAATYADPNYRLLVGNALRWVASPEGATWARARRLTAAP